MNMKRLLYLAVIMAGCLSASGADARYVFYFIGDGMGMSQIMAADTYNRLVLGNPGKLPMMEFPVNSFATTYSASSPVTDSAAAGTALSTGSKTRNGMLGMNADTIAVESVAKKLHDAGFGVSIVTTVAADDATPGAFYAHVPHRSHYYDIGRQAAGSGYEIIGGASFRGFKDKKGNPTDLAEIFETNGVEIIKGAEGIASTDSRRVILIPAIDSWDWNAGYTVDSIPGALTLSDLTSSSISHLMKHSPDRFFIMAEGGNIDHAGHANDAGTSIKEILNFNEAISLAFDFYRHHPDETLIVVTADHETGGMSLGNQTTGYNALLQYFTPQKYSKERFSVWCDTMMASEEEKPTWDDMRQILADNFGFFTVVPLTDEQEAELKNVFEDTFVNGNGRRQSTLYANFNQFAVEVIEMLNDIAGIGWTTLSHSGAPVPVFAIGAGSELFIGNNDNTQIPQKIYQATGLAK